MKITAQQVVQAFQALTIPQQAEFFRTVSTGAEFPAVVRDVAEAAARELADYMDFHGVSA